MKESLKFIHLESKRIKISQYLVFGYQSEGNYIISPFYQPKNFSGDTLVWILPKDSCEKSFMISCGSYSVRTQRNGIIEISFENEYKTAEMEGRPACDFLGNFIALDIAGGQEFMQAYAHFYWDNLLPEIAERTFMHKKKDIRDGYVLSTLKEKVYGGTYPAVDHEFHIKGRYAVGGKAELSLIKRMLELQMKIMREDKQNLSRNVCSVQPDGRREYNVWRRSKNLKNNAQMFRITANIEFIEEMYQYYSASKDLDFITDNISALEKNCSYIESFISSDGLLNSHVYFEDQVIKDGNVAQAQCFACNSFRLMAELELLAGNPDKTEYYKIIANKLGECIVKDFPAGYWDKENKRFIDWIDANGQAHDHIHLLANELSCLFSLATEEQKADVAKLVSENDRVFSKFPSYVAAKIEDYTDSEIGTGGPYDLCAAGRYWCWDARYKAFMKDGKTLLKQLTQVASQAEIDNYLMGERYDMNYIYYIDEKNWHGAALYYEYPNVFLFVLVTQYLGVSFGFGCDVTVKPLITSDGSVELQNYGIKYTLDKGSFKLENLRDCEITVEIDLTGIGIKCKNKLTLKANSKFII
jgi:hypothetical protein